MAYDGHDEHSVGKLRGALGVNLAPADRGLEDPLTEDSFLALASLVTANLAFTAKTRGPDGNDVTVAFVEAGNDTALSVAVTGTDIVVNLATDSGGAATSTAAEVAGAIEADVDADELVSVDVVSAGVVAAMAVTALSGGEDVLAGLAAFQGGYPRHDGS